MDIAAPSKIATITFMHPIVVFGGDSYPPEHAVNRFIARPSVGVCLAAAEGQMLDAREGCSPGVLVRPAALFSELFVIARNSSFQDTGRAVDVGQVEDYFDGPCKAKTETWNAAHPASDRTTSKPDARLAKRWPGRETLLGAPVP